MSAKYVHTCIRVLDPDASRRFYGALGFEPRGRLTFSSAYNLYMGLPGGGMAAWAARPSTQTVGSRSRRFGRAR